MDKREFLKGSGAVVAGTLLKKIARGQTGAANVEKRTNWAGNYTYRAKHLDVPGDVEQIRRAIAGHAEVKALGARHSFNGIADTRGADLAEALNEMKLDAEAHTVTVGAGVTYGDLAPYLDAQGFALHNLASLPHISVAGACATGTHGSGIKNGNLSTAVRAIEMVTADGEVVTSVAREGWRRFAGAVVGLGALGVMTKMTLAVEPRFR